TIPIWDNTSSTVFPLPNKLPARQLRLCTLVDVTIKSPTPHNPKNVNGFAPIEVPSRVISAKPRVINAALALSQKPKPSDNPEPNAIIFIKAPPNSTPTTSALV